MLQRHSSLIEDAERIIEKKKLAACDASNGLEKLELNRRHPDQADTPWFPRTPADLDLCQHLHEKTEEDPITADHPGYNDAEYRERRRIIAELALSYRYGDPIPKVVYSEKETDTWKNVYKILKPLHKKAACRQYLEVFHELEAIGLYSADRIPQLKDVSDYIQSQTGFRLRPVAGLVSSRDFLGSLAVKVFQCTQYVRHHLSPMHTPEPDCCHELLGHVPMLCDEEFANFSQEIGLMSLGLSDEDTEKLATLYWFTIEFGMCREDKAVKAYGAGILSAYGEMEHALSDKPQKFEFDPSKASIQPYRDDDYQEVYFIAESFEKALYQMRKYSEKTFFKPFRAWYNAATETVEVVRKNSPPDFA